MCDAAEEKQIPGIRGLNGVGGDGKTSLNLRMVRFDLDPPMLPMVKGGVFSSILNRRQ
jgi:hypothetical protein